MKNREIERPIRDCYGVAKHPILSEILGLGEERQKIFRFFFVSMRFFEYFEGFYPILSVFTIDYLRLMTNTKSN